MVISDFRELKDMNFSKLHGRITNKSQKYAINAVALKIFYKDCPSEASTQSCSTVGEESALIMKTVLPGETTEFYTFIPSNPPVANKFLLVDRLVDYVEASKVENEKSK